MAEENAKEITSTPKETTPASRALSPFEEFDRMLENLFDRDWMHRLRSGWERPLWDRVAPLEPRMPKVDIVDRDSEVLVRAEIPGVERKDLDVSVTDNTVTIKGQSSRETKEEKGDYYRCEISRGAFARTIALPSEVDADRAEAKFSDGILELALPKIKEARRRKIEVK